MTETLPTLESYPPYIAEQNRLYDLQRNREAVQRRIDEIHAILGQQDNTAYKKNVTDTAALAELGLAAVEKVPAHSDLRDELGKLYERRRAIMRAEEMQRTRMTEFATTASRVLVNPMAERHKKMVAELAEALAGAMLAQKKLADWYDHFTEAGLSYTGAFRPAIFHPLMSPQNPNELACQFLDDLRRNGLITGNEPNVAAVRKLQADAEAKEVAAREAEANRNRTTMQRVGRKIRGVFSRS